ncbi:respiratory supercomplex factor 2, mitochondrial [[Candida] railenensis]|uniref:Respiratory supercomplex factor 2, mitochondrial n=1 Tax=[Candida] railenensis TaxID=45579 RepID=A0A9P0VYC3_9ASCO|nr:respiratory supercomplex factor 2, mitochondrial [[Candida] railenensis]
MKILSNEEKNAHWNTVLEEGIKGCAVGAVLSIGFAQYVKRRNPVRFAQLSTSVKSAMYAMPTIGMGAFFADEGSVRFDREQYQSDYLKKLEEEKLAKWEKLSLADKCFTKVNDNKYKIILSAWAASLYGSWKYVNRDPIMTATQKAVQARMYAQAFTVILLLGTILLSMHEAELKKAEPAPVPEWKRYLDEQEQLKKIKQAEN